VLFSLVVVLRCAETSELADAAFAGFSAAVIITAGL
jgi:hypothetical protein